MRRIRDWNLRARLALIFSTWLSRPILAITRGNRRMAGGDLSQRVDVRTGGELEEGCRL